MEDWKTWVMARLQSAVGFYFVSESAADGFATVKTHPAKPPARTGILNVRRMWPFGIKSRVPEGVPSITVGPMASETQKIMIAAESQTYGPNDLEVGDTAIYSAADRLDPNPPGAQQYCRIVAGKDGRITIHSKGGATVVVDENGKITIDAVNNQDVVVNGGILKVARVTDLTTCGVLQINAVAVGAIAGTYTDPDGAVAPFTLGAPINIVGRIAPGGGALHFKA